MPRTPINYENTYIYQICCLDPNITDIYIGHTTDMVRRKNEHKSRCINQNGLKYHLNVYQFIRANGGWDNWTMIFIEKCNCSNSFEARAKEQHYIKSLKASLNTRVPNRTLTEYYDDDKTKEHIKNYYEINKDKIIERDKNYRDNNKDKINNYRKQYYI